MKHCVWQWHTIVKSAETQIMRINSAHKYPYYFLFASLFCRQKLNFTGKTARSRFVPPFGGRRGNVHGSSMARWKACGLLVLVLIELFSQLSRLRHYEWIFVEIVVFERGVSCGVVCMIVRLAILIQYRRVTDTQTDT